MRKFLLFGLSRRDLRVSSWAIALIYLCLSYFAVSYWFVADVVSPANYLLVMLANLFTDAIYTAPWLYGAILFLMRARKFIFSEHTRSDLFLKQGPWSFAASLLGLVWVVFVLNRSYALMTNEAISQHVFGLALFASLLLMMLTKSVLEVFKRGVVAVASEIAAKAEKN